MATISHRLVQTNGIRLHIAESGPEDGPCVILCHGFPESWYSWRHQLQSLGDAGYRVIAPDMRGMGRSSRPMAPQQYTQPKLVGDMVGLLEVLPHETAVIAGHDWGAPVAWNAALMRPDLFTGVIGLSVPYYGARTTFTYDHTVPPSISMDRETGPGFHYQLYFNEVGRAEADLELDVRHWLQGFFFSISGDAPPEEVTLGDLVRGDKLADALTWPRGPIPWLSDEDLDFYAGEYERTGFGSALNYYRAADYTWHEMAAFRGAKITVPACFIAGADDIVLAANADLYQNMPIEVPDLRANVLIPGIGHWTQQEAPEETSKAMLAFLADVTSEPA
ncbi:alpha/beta fold hydrolase [Aeromicrobium wangtongii]|uniref:alpha/beta fold hydrolase n=1 Tax=Aeromicrobium wangtongii TaxID=2969247 RepID=UPI0020180662|nr:alpha/beta hydrolase [Aeromicrobium wangtongii]MCL3818625.1 alpha/beta hydrolase [Aeromicrobium wangtongii]